MSQDPSPDRSSPFALSPPISIGGRHTQSAHRSARHPRNDRIGGDVVGDIKRGTRSSKTASGGGKELRTKVLLAVALLLFVILTSVWVMRLIRRVQTLGGFGGMLSKAQKRFADLVAPTLTKWAQREEL
ncbi:hypothetical protein B9479_002903 [Cryptococcus floricola]|uniref:Uncharacterized protein n=1 Tax=Cryptococcus floricola TaxID=2591691 RepID=A0A5D3AYF1_9TREE|nr:hypothetical protein B9479_002903 [Cryptococcus floricola]